MKKLLTILLIAIAVLANAQPVKKPQVAVPAPKTKVKFVVVLTELKSLKSGDGGNDYEEEIYGAISVCLAAQGYPPTRQLDYTYKNPVDKEIGGGVDPVPSLSTNTNGRVLWRQSDSKTDRRIHLDSRSSQVRPDHKYLGRFSINTQSVFIFDLKTDPQAALRFFADMWESDFDDDEHFTVGNRRVIVPLSSITVGQNKRIEIQIWDSSSRHYAVIDISSSYVD